MRCIEAGITPLVTKQNFANATGDREFYSDRFTYDKEQNVYRCPEGQELFQGRRRKKDGKIIGYDYRNAAACNACKSRERCTRNKRGRIIFRHVNQDLLEKTDLKLEHNRKLYKQRQMIVEHPFGTIKRIWGADHFLTRGTASVATEVSLVYLAYNMRRAINIIGVKEMVKRLQDKRELAVT